MVVANPPQLWESKLLFHPPQISARSLCWWCQSRSQKHKLSATTSLPTPLSSLRPQTHTLMRTSLQSRTVNCYIHTQRASKQLWAFLHDCVPEQTVHEHARVFCLQTHRHTDTRPHGWTGQWMKTLQVSSRLLQSTLLFNCNLSLQCFLPTLLSTSTSLILSLNNYHCYILFDMLGLWKCNRTMVNKHY